MRVCFTGFDSPMVIDDTAVSVLEVQNRALFARVCESLASGLGVDAIEPYSLWADGDVELRPGSQVLLVASPLALPWDDKLLSGGLATRLEKIAFEDEEVRQSIEEAFSALRSRLSQVALGLDSDYTFGVDWELKRYRRTYGFGVDLVEDEPLIDKLIKFLKLAKDASLSRALLFANLKLFLTDNDLDLFFEQVFFSRLQVLLIENVHDASCRPHERNYTIDQDFLESW